MSQPFEGLLGDTCETRLLQFLLPMYGIEFTMTELVGEIGLTRQSIAKAMNKFAERGMVKIRRDGRTPFYTINGDSPLVKRLEDFDNSLIESIAGPGVFDKNRKKTGPGAGATGPGIFTQDAGKPPVRYNHTPSKISGIASPAPVYRRTGKKPAQ